MICPLNSTNIFGNTNMKIKQQTLYKVFVKLLVNSQMLEVQADTDFDKLDGSFGEITGIDEE